MHGLQFYLVCAEMDSSVIILTGLFFFFLDIIIGIHQISVNFYQYGVTQERGKTSTTKHSLHKALKKGGQEQTMNNYQTQ